MISLQITDVKDFMAKLLKTDLFDHFLMPEAVITTSVTSFLQQHPSFVPAVPHSIHFLQHTI